MKNLKIGILVLVVGVIFSSVVFASNLLSEVYLSPFNIKLNGSQYTPEMPVLNYLGRTYLALRELGTVTGNEVDFVNGEIIINNEEQPKFVSKKEVTLNGKKHNLEVKYYYNEEDIKLEGFYSENVRGVEGTKKILLDNQIVATSQETFFVESDYSKIESYVINDKRDGKQYVVLAQYNYPNERKSYYIFGEKANLLASFTDMSYGDQMSASFHNLQYNHAQGGHNEMYPEIRDNGLQLCYPFYYDGTSEKEWLVDWCKTRYYIYDGQLKTEVIKIYDANMIRHAGAT